MKRSGLFLFCLILFSISQILAEGRITDRLESAISKSQEEGTTVRAIIVLEDRLDVSALSKQLYATKATLGERAYTVITELKQHASRTQTGLLNVLQSKSQEDVPEYQEFWITNVITLEATPEILLELGNRTDISYIDLKERARLIEPVRTEPAPASLPGQAEPGLRVINAHRMWEEGFTGQGVIVMNLDTGVEGTHPALADRWRGNHVPASHAWFDPYYGTTFPTDTGGSEDDGHGTHTMGTITGLDPVTADTIGVAPGAEWIAARNPFGVDNRLLVGLQWALDPDGDPGTTDDMPAVVSNSWYWDLTPCSTPLDEAITALEAAGIAVVFAAGNSGPSPETVVSPAKINTTEMMVYSVGALDGNDPVLPVTPFSSRGPTNCIGDGNQIKPEVSAPGDVVRSSYLNGEYAYGSGTSMATPHVAGAIALLKQAYPEKTGEELKMMLYASARDLGEQGEDNEYGMGVIDVYAAYHISLQDPWPPTGMVAYSDYTTPTSAQLSWTDPTHLVGGDTLTDFRIGIWRDGQLVAGVAQGVESYTDNGLTDGMYYEYELRTQDLSTDSLSMPVSASVYAGGSPFPAPPSDLTCDYNGTNVILTWNDPATQSDGTPIDDLEKIYIYRDDALMDSVSAGVETYTDSVGVGFTVYYFLRAVDNEVPPNPSDPGERVPCFIGITPDFLVWVGPDAYGPNMESGDSLFAALAANGESVFLTNDLFEFGTDLSIYDGIFVVLGVWWYNHVLERTDPEPQALESYLLNGGRIYLEGGTCFNWDPSGAGGYNIRPWFGLGEGETGDPDVLGIDGQDFLSSFHFDYEGRKTYTDDLEPLGSTVIWQNDSNEDVCGVWNVGFGSGLSIGVVPSFGGLVNNSQNTRSPETLKQENQAEKIFAGTSKVRPPRPDKSEPVEFIKKFSHKPHLKSKRKHLNDLLKLTGDGVHLMANTKTELMAAYLELFRSNPPYAQNSTINSIYLSPGTDSLIVTCEIVNPDSHSITVQSVIESFDQSFIDSVEMFDDGNHYDGAPNDGKWGAYWRVPAEERSYSARIYTHSITLGTTHRYNVDEYFTTIGPVDLKRYFFISQDTLPNPGDILKLKLTLRNEGTTAIALGVTAGLTSLDTCASVPNPNDPTYGDIAAGDTASTAGWHWIFIGEDCPGEGEILFAIDVASESNTFWSDTLSVFVYPVGIEDDGEARVPLVFALNQNYPNPFNPQTTIRFSIPSRTGALDEKERVILRIYNMRGQLVTELLNEELTPGSYTIQWDGRGAERNRVPSGVFFFKLTWGDRSSTRKMVILK